MRGKIRPDRATPVARLAGVAAILALVALILAACGGSGASTASSSTSPAGISAYLNCLRQHGVNVPTAPPTAAPGSGGFGGGFGGAGFGSGNSTFQQAAQACASLRPSGGFGHGFGGGFASALQAFRSCMSSHGEPIPTTQPTSPPAAGSAPIDRVLNGLNPSNPSVAAALKACESELPSFFQSS